MAILITGATGLIGSEIVKQCHRLDLTVHYLTTSKDKIVERPNYKGFYWNPKKQEIDVACFKSVETVINLAGASISHRWTASYKNEIMDSRLQALRLLKATLFQIDHQVTHILSASAIGIYPDSLTNYYEEDHPEVSNAFLGKVAQAWEAEADGFSVLGLKVSKIRIGLVLSDHGGALPQMANPIRYHAGAVLGKGTQWQSWIHLEDVARLFVFVMLQNLEGTFNAVAPNPVTHADLTTAMAKQLGKPLFLPNIPKFLMKLVLGEMHILLFESQRVSSKKIAESGFDFRFSKVQKALEDLLE